jgi:hypothetical protein
MIKNISEPFFDLLENGVEVLKSIAEGRRVELKITGERAKSEVPQTYISNVVSEGLDETEGRGGDVHGKRVLVEAALGLDEPYV